MSKDRGRADKGRVSASDTETPRLSLLETLSKSRRAGRGEAQVIPITSARRKEPHRSKPQGSKASGNGGSPGVGRRRVLVVLGAFTIASCVLSLRAMHINVSDATNFEAFATEQVANVHPEVRRGDILSSDGRKLATSVQAVRVISTPYQVEERDVAARKLRDVISSETDLTEQEISERLSGDGEDDGYSLIETVSPGTAERVLELGLSGVYLEPTTDRIYPDGDLASQVIGNLNTYGETFGGVESHYDRKLDSGSDITLTMDSAVQRELQNALSETIGKFGADNAVGVVMRVDDGSIVALASSPTYDNNEYAEASPEKQRNRAITDPYEPGSTLKPFTFAAALQEGAISEQSTFTVPDSYQVSDHIIHDSVSHETEVMTPAEILARSSNVGTVQIAEALGASRLHRYLGEFGFGESTGLDLVGESSGRVPDLEEWSGVSIGNIPIGQGLTATPLQLARAYATLANGGVTVTPHVISGGETADAGERVISERTSDIVSRMLRGVVQDGTGNLAAIPGYSVVGKTGTSQKVDLETGTYSEEDYYASFVGFAPASDPEYVTLIVVDSPRESIWGERVAAPAFRKVMKFTLTYFNVPPDMPADSGEIGETG